MISLRVQNSCYQASTLAILPTLALRQSPYQKNKLLFNTLTLKSQRPPFSQFRLQSHCRKPSKLSKMDAYVFPDGRLKKKMDDPSKTPLLLVACGSFSPVTFLHLRMFTMAADYVKFSTDFEIIGGYFSPVSDAYKKAGLASAEHR